MSGLEKKSPFVLTPAESSHFLCLVLEFLSVGLFVNPPCAVGFMRETALSVNIYSCLIAALDDAV